jgi:hypothetical protein
MRTLGGLVIAFSLIAVTAAAQGGGTVTGRVTTETGGLPVAGARVLGNLARGHDGLRWTVLDPFRQRRLFYDRHYT